MLGSGGRAQQDAGTPGDGPPIRLRAATFVPTRGEAPAIPPGLAIAGYAQGQRGYYLLQFGGPVLDAWKGDLEALGIEILDYIPEFAFKVRMTPAQAAQASTRQNVAWVGLFHPAYKISPDLPRNGPALYVVRIERGVDAGPATAAIAAAGAQIVERDGSVLTVSASGAQVNAIARVLDVASIEPFRMRERHNDDGAGRIVRSIAANDAGWDGSSQIVAIADTGLGNGLAHDAHIDLAGRVTAIHNWPGSSNANCYDVINDGAVDVASGHGTHVALSAVGSGGTGVVGRGAAPGARLLFQAVENWALRATDVETCELAFTIVNEPACGTLSSPTDQSCVSGSPNQDTALVTYTPPPTGGPYDVSFTYRATDGLADSNLATVTIAVAAAPPDPPDDPPTDPPADPTHVHVGDLDGAATNMGRGYWQASITIEVHDNTHTPVSGATVMGTWSGSFPGEASCTTNGSGRCTVSTGQIHNSSQTVIWTVSG